MFAFCRGHVTIIFSGLRYCGLQFTSDLVGRAVMISFRTLLLMAAVLLAFTLVDMRFMQALAEGVPPKVVDGAAAVPAAPPAETVTTTVKDKKKAVVKRKKSRKKRAAKKGVKADAETSLGERLTSNQVVDILKKTRDLSGKNLSGLQLVGINLSKCNMRGVNLKNANLERADLGESDLERADLSGANLKMSNLRLSGMTGVNLERAILDGAIWKDGRVCAAGSVGQCREFASPSIER